MATTTPKGTLVWSNAPTATQSVQPSQTPVTPSGSLQWTSSPTYSVDDIFSTPEDTRSTADILRETFGYTQNIDRQKEIASRYIAGKSSTPEMLATTGMNTVGAFLSPVVKGVGKVLQGVDYVISGKGEYNPIPTKNLYTDLKQGTVETYNSAVDTISDSTTVQKYANTESSKSFEEYLRGVNDLLAITPLPKVVVATNKAMSAAEEYALQQLNKARQSNADSSLQKVIAQIEQVEKVGAKSKIPYSAKDALVTQKMAQSNVLPQTVDKTGTVDATAIKEAQRQYLEQPIGQQEDGSPITVRNAESVVGRLLKQEGATVNINEVIGSLVSAVERTGLAADIMERAMRVGIPNYTMALMKYADEFGNIKLEDIHTEKIRTTSNLDYSKPASTVYRKALGTGLRKIIENKSKHPISEINQELGIHLEAVKRIGKLAGKKVEGGRFGIHVARGVGTGLGIVLGSVAGPVGGAVAGAIGGGIGTAVQTAKMQRTFGKQGKSTMPGSDLIEKASIEASKPPVRDLSKPDVPVGARKSIPKTKEILRLERSIKENVQAQKEAIKAKDFVLVEKLKDIYDHLVAKLKSAIQRIKDTPNKQGGFANWNPSKSRTPSEHQKSGGKSSADTTTHLAKAQEALREAKGLSASDIMAKYPDINLKRDVTVTDIHGKKSVIPAGEALTPYELKGNKVLLQDGETYIVSKNQFQNIKGNAVSGEAKEFAPELKGTEESVRGKPLTEKEFQNKHWSDELKMLDKKVQNNTITNSEFAKYRKLYADTPTYNSDTALATKYENYTLPDGKNYKEVLIKAPKGERVNSTLVAEAQAIAKKHGYELDANNLTKTDSYGQTQLDVIDDELYGTPDGKRFSEINNKLVNSKGEDVGTFKSSHWDEPNVISHLRLNERTYKGKPVTFMEELQSDWAREGRKHGMAQELTKDNLIFEKKGTTNPYWEATSKDGTMIARNAGNMSREDFVKYAIEIGNIGKIPNNPLLKNWQTLSVKRALQEAVANKSEYFAWINGEQTSARYNLATHVKEVGWIPAHQSFNSKVAVGKPVEKVVSITPQTGGVSIDVGIDNAGVIHKVNGGGSSDWVGKKLDEVLGKGLADSIMSKESGTLSGDGLKFGGEWANTLYDKQVGNIVKDVTGGEIIDMDMGLPVEKAETQFTIARGERGTDFQPIRTSDLEVGKQISNGRENYIITDILGDGKFKAVPKNLYDEAYKSNIKEITLPSGNKGYEWTAEDGRKVKTNSLENAKKGISWKLDNLNQKSETFDISTKTTTQQGIRLTPEIIARIKGEAIPLKPASGRSPI